MKGDAVIRTYSLEAHGKEFEKLADQFASKVPGREIKAVLHPEVVPSAAAEPAKRTKKKPGEPHYKKGEAVAVFAGDVRIRTYSEEDHGDDFADLAKQFASKVEGREAREVLTAQPKPGDPPLPTKQEQEDEDEGGEVVGRY